MSDKRTTADPVAKGASGDKVSPEAILGPPNVNNGADMWRVARDSQKLDLNSSYAYLLWAEDFAETSAVATVDGQVVGFVIGYLRPQRPDTLLIWQIAVDGSQRGKGLAGKLLDHLLERLGESVRYLDTTVTPDNAASIALFESLAKRWSATIENARLFEAEQFPDEHEAEDLYRIGPLR